MNVTITEFLLARIAEDEATARGAVGNRWAGHYYREVRTAVEDNPSYYSVTAERTIFEHWDRSRNRVDPGTTYEHIARHDPARVLAECAAKRAIAESWHLADHARRIGHSWLEDALAEDLEDHIKALAAVYKDHPDYQQKWAV